MRVLNADQERRAGEAAEAEPYWEANAPSAPTFPAAPATTVSASKQQ
jgi:hypothetical protein